MRQIDNNNTNNEIWKSVVGYEGIYEVSNLGNVRSVDRKVKRGNVIVFVHGTIMGKHKIKGNYLRVHLSKRNKTKFVLVHRLVAEAFLPNPKNMPQINHKDCNPENNNVTNLEWCTQMYNNHYGERILNVSKKLVNGVRCKQIARCDLQGNIIEVYPSVAECHRRNSTFLPSRIYECLHGHSFTHKKYKWKYYEKN